MAEPVFTEYVTAAFPPRVAASNAAFALSFRRTAVGLIVTESPEAPCVLVEAFGDDPDVADVADVDGLAFSGISYG